jgi:signal transduction histidine kinase
VRDVDELRRHADEVNREVQDAVRDAEQATRDAESEARDADRTLRELESELRTARGNDAEEFEGLREATIEAADEVRVARDAVREARETERRLRIESARVIVDARATDSPEAETISTFEFNFAPFAPEPPAPPVPPAPGAPGVAPAAPAAPAPPPVFSSAPPGTMLISSFEISAELPDGRWLVMRQGRNWAELGWIGRAALVLGCVLTILFVLALLIARRLTLPIRNFSEAVQAVGVDPQNAPVREEGPRELRGAARAVNAMQARLRSLIADRTKTLAAVAHDMRTPLMRLRLAAENTLQRERMGKEIDEVEALVASFIAFARDDPAEEARVRLDIAALLQSIADDHVAAGHNVRYSGDERLVVTGQSLGLKRLFNNLIENALKYGSSARIAMRQEASGVVVDIEDDGPGVPADQRESVFEAFVRLESGEIKGAGLGLPAARSIARAHGGDVAILDGERGALVRVTLPG